LEDQVLKVSHDVRYLSDIAVLEQFQQRTPGLYFAGFRSKQLLKQAYSLSDAGLLPSRFLETF
jgi:hypothetical protein